MRNHEWVPVEVISRIAKLRGGETYKVIRKLLKNKFVVHTGKRCNYLLDFKMMGINWHIWAMIIWHCRPLLREAF